jgi:ribose transport system substrate-binding protein
MKSVKSFSRTFLLAAAAVAAVAGVWSAAPSNADDAAITIGVSIPSATHGWTGGLNYHARLTIDRLQKQYPNLKIILETAGSASEQVNDIEDMTSAQKLDGLVVLPFESAPLTAPVKQVADSGVYVTVVDRGLSEPGIEDLYIAGDNPALGRVAAEYINGRLPDGGKVVLMRGLPTEIDNERVDGFVKALHKNIEVLDMKHSNWNRDDGFAVMQDYLTRFPKIDAVWTQDDDTSLGVIDATREAGREGEFFIVGGGGMKQVVKMVMDKERKDMPVTVSYPPSMIASAIELTAEHVVNKLPIDGRYIINTTLISPDNAALFYFPDSPY